MTHFDFYIFPPDRHFEKEKIWITNKTLFGENAKKFFYLNMKQILYDSLKPRFKFEN